MSESLPPPSARRRFQWHLIGLLFACLIVGLYACLLNWQLYQHHHPFYDSMSYHEKMFRVITISRESGLLSSLETACFENNTVALPFLVGALIAPVIEPSRAVGIWFQTGLLFAMLASLWVYLVRIRGVHPDTALAGCLAFLTTKCLFIFNGGLSDFRMDLSLYLGFGLTCIWYLTSMAKPTAMNFFLLGVSAAIACLCRATAPIYLLFCLGPICLIELVFSAAQRRQKILGLVGATLTVIVLAGWFYVLNFDFLKFYYVDWNTDANAKIPFVEAIQHWSLAQRGVGAPLAIMLLCWGIGIIWVTSKSETVSNWVRRAWTNRELDWRIGWLALAPVIMMVARQAGLNPFVTMPAVFGLVLVFLLPCLIQLDRLSHPPLTRFCWTMLFVCLVVSAVRGWKRHAPDGFDTRTAHNQVIDRLLTNANEHSQEKIRFGVLHLTEFNTNSLYSSLLFDRPDAQPNQFSVGFDDVQISRIHTFSRPAATDWRLVKGDSDQQKMEGMLVDAANRIDYLILPDQASAAAIQTSHAHNYINRYVVPLRNQIVNDPAWVNVGAPIPTGYSEVVEIYRRVR